MHTEHSWPLPKLGQLHTFLSDGEHEALLDWVLSNERLFRPAKITNDAPGPKGIVDPSFRVGLTTRDLGPLRSTLEERMSAALPALERATGVRAAASSVELELAAHGDGAYYKPHRDISTGSGRKAVGAKDQDRVLSAVYYFYREPKGFSGGALRLFRFNARPRDEATGPEHYFDVEPVQNCLVAFPSWATHEVRPIMCPSATFANYRFALNCWFCRSP